MSLEVHLQARGGEISSQPFGVELRGIRDIYQFLQKPIPSNASLSEEDLRFVEGDKEDEELLATLRAEISLNLRSNWDSISSADYDVIREISGTIKSSLENIQKNEGERPQYRRNFSLDLILDDSVLNRKGPHWAYRAQDVIAGLESLGLAGKMRGDPEKIIEGKKCIDIVGVMIDFSEKPKIGIHFQSPTTSFLELRGKTHAFLFWENENSSERIELTENEISGYLSKLSEVVSKLLMVQYALEGKKLPSKSLVFIPDEKEIGKSDTLEIICGYCSSGYESKYGRCPHCGGPRG